MAMVSYALVGHAEEVFYGALCDSMPCVRWEENGIHSTSRRICQVHKPETAVP